MLGEDMIKVKGLRKKFDEVTALDSFCMNVHKGSIYGLVGINGAGKTTAMKSIVGILLPDAGSVEIGGSPVYDNVQTKEKLFFVPENLDFFSEFTLREAERFFSSFYRAWDNRLFREIVSAFDLNNQHKISRFSKGMRKQTAFALAMASCPEYLILDEPVDGLDPMMRRLVRKYMVGAAADRGMTTLISSHNLREVEYVCDTIGIISKGRMILERDLDDLKENIYKVQVAFDHLPSNRQALYSELNVLHRKERNNLDLLVVKNNMQTLDDFNEREAPLLFDVTPLSLEEIFLYELGGAEDDIHEIIR
jgi:ABC-2 type transport system ATP-binding protein